jgi:hypothetical protein
MKPFKTKLNLYQNIRYTLNGSYIKFDKTIEILI